MQNDVFEFEGGEVKVWIEQESIHIHACDKRHRDPVELTSNSARQLAKKLEELANAIDG
jgi:hypothetical protein